MPFAAIENLTACDNAQKERMSPIDFTVDLIIQYVSKEPVARAI